MHDLLSFEELKENEARFRAIFDSAFQLTGVVDPLGAIIVANQTSLGAVGARLEDVVGVPLWDSLWVVSTPHTRERLKREIPRAAAGAFVRYDLDTTLPDGAARIYDFSLKPVRDASGAVTQIVVEGRDITELKETQAALMQAQKVEVLGQLTGGVAHDFNNLLMAVIANLDLLRKRVAGDAKSERLLDGAMQGAKRGATLTQRLLAFARRQELHAEAVDLAALVDGMRDLLVNSVGPMIELRLDRATALPPAQVDPHQLELAILNLTVNARDAMPNGGAITIAISAAGPQDAPPAGLPRGPYLRLCVADTGAGMDETTLSRAVEPFFSTKERGKGTGLGLSMVHGLAVQSGGALQLASALGRGTTATVWLPAARDEPRAAAAKKKVRLRDIAPATILVVDDDALIAMSTADMLQDLGHTTLEAYSGAEALKIVREHPIQLIITDYAMPGMTGLELAQAAQAIRPGLPVLLATGYADLPDGTDLALPYLAKPYAQQDLATQVAKVLDA